MQKNDQINTQHNNYQIPLEHLININDYYRWHDEELEKHNTRRVRRSRSGKQSKN